MYVICDAAFSSVDLFQNFCSFGFCDAQLRSINNAYEFLLIYVKSIKIKLLKSP